VLLLVDTSGSMEWKSSGDVSPTCDPDQSEHVDHDADREEPLDRARRNAHRHGRNYSCYANNATRRRISRKSSSSARPTFPTISATTDAYHRPMSSQCVPGPGALPAHQDGRMLIRSVPSPIARSRAEPST